MDIAEDHPLAHSAAAIVFYGEVFGIAVGLLWVGISDRINAKKCVYSRDTSEKIGNPHPYEAYFIAFVTCAVSIYVICYLLAALKFAESAGPDEWPISKYIAGITGATVFLLMFFAVKYAAHVRLTLVLELALEKLPGDRSLISGLRKAVFRGDQLYEPAGNVFVTLGITATFLGLAVGLVILDIPALFGGNIGDSTLTGAADGAVNAIDPDSATRAAVASLRSFVGCMGLALGVSMLGVMTALAAQGLRARGATLSTEELLSHASKALAGILAAEADEEAKAAKIAKAKAAKAAKAAKTARAAEAARTSTVPSNSGNGGLHPAASQLPATPSANNAPQHSNPASKSASLDELEANGSGSEGGQGHD